MFWTFMLFLTAAGSGVVLGYHVYQLWQMFEFYKNKKSENVENFIKGSIEFSKLYHTYSPKLSKFHDGMKDHYQQEAFKSFLLNKDLGPHCYEQLGLVTEFFKNRIHSQMDELRGFARGLPLLGWAAVLTAVCFYFSEYMISKSPFILTSQFVGFAVVAVVYALCLDMLIIQPWVKQLKSEAEMMSVKEEIMKMTVHNLLLGRTTLELSKSLEVFTKPHETKRVLKVA